MNTQNQTPAQVADEYEMLAQLCTDEGDAVLAAQYMKGARAIRRLLTLVMDMDHRVHNGYDWNADSDGMTAAVGAVIAGDHIGEPTEMTRMREVMVRVSKEADFSQCPGLEDEVDAVLAK